MILAFDTHLGELSFTGFVGQRRGHQLYHRSRDTARFVVQSRRGRGGDEVVRLQKGVNLVHGRLLAQEVEHGAVELHNSGVDGVGGESPFVPDRGVEGGEEAGGGQALEPLGKDAVPQKGDGSVRVETLVRKSVCRPSSGDRVDHNRGDGVKTGCVRGGLSEAVKDLGEYGHVGSAGPVDVVRQLILRGEVLMHLDCGDQVYDKDLVGLFSFQRNPVRRRERVHTRAQRGEDATPAGLASSGEGREVVHDARGEIRGLGASGDRSSPGSRHDEGAEGERQVDLFSGEPQPMPAPPRRGGPIGGALVRVGGGGGPISPVGGAGVVLTHRHVPCHIAPFRGDHGPFAVSENNSGVGGVESRDVRPTFAVNARTDLTVREVDVGGPGGAKAVSGGEDRKCRDGKPLPIPLLHGLPVREEGVAGVRETLEGGRYGDALGEHPGKGLPHGHDRGKDAVEPVVSAELTSHHAGDERLRADLRGGGAVPPRGGDLHDGVPVGGSRVGVVRDLDTIALQPGEDGRQVRGFVGNDPDAQRGCIPSTGRRVHILREDLEQTPEVPILVEDRVEQGDIRLHRRPVEGAGGAQGEEGDVRGAGDGFEEGRVVVVFPASHGAVVPVSSGGGVGSRSVFRAGVLRAVGRERVTRYGDRQDLGREGSPGKDPDLESAGEGGYPPQRKGKRGGGCARWRVPGRAWSARAGGTIKGLISAGAARALRTMLAGLRDLAGE